MSVGRERKCEEEDDDAHPPAQVVVVDPKLNEVVLVRRALENEPLSGLEHL